jgi:hypothetical protein
MISFNSSPRYNNGFEVPRTNSQAMVLDDKTRFTGMMKLRWNSIKLTSMLHSLILVITKRPATEWT